VNAGFHIGDGRVQASTSLPQYGQNPPPKAFWCIFTLKITLFSVQNPHKPPSAYTYAFTEYPVNKSFEPVVATPHQFTAINLQSNCSVRSAKVKLNMTFGWLSEFP